MIFGEIPPRAVRGANCALVIAGVDDEKGGAGIRRYRRKRQVEPRSAVSYKQYMADDFRVLAAITKPAGELQSARFGLGNRGAVRHRHINQELVALAERKHLFRHAVEHRRREHDQRQTRSQHDR